MLVLFSLMCSWSTNVWTPRNFRGGFCFPRLSAHLPLTPRWTNCVVIYLHCVIQDVGSQTLRVQFATTKICMSVFFPYLKTHHGNFASCLAANVRITTYIKAEPFPRFSLLDYCSSYSILQ